jgi:surface-anchored protein
MRTRALAAAAFAATVALLLPGTAHAAISQGHVDALDIDWTGSALTLDIRDATVTPAVDRDPATTVLDAVSASKTTVPANAAYSFLGTAGSPIWILPQSAVNGILWPGFNTEGVPSGVVQGNTVTATLVSVNGPNGSAGFSVYSQNLGTPTVWFHSTDGTPDSRNFAINVHSHANWAFKAAGTYTIVFEVTATTAGGSPVSSGQKTYTFTVQP